jgi:hypothetical protein
MADLLQEQRDHITPAHGEQMILIVPQAFADEIFRVFANAHPEIELYPVRANSDVKRTIESAKLEKLHAVPSLSPV